MDRQQAHQLLDDLNPLEFSAVVQLLEVLVARKSFSQVPIEDEEITVETASAIDHARTSLARGEVPSKRPATASPVYNRHVCTSHAAS